MRYYQAEIKWGIRRGGDTYGYTTCSLYIDGRKVAACNGGGYDMTGTVFGTWVAYAFDKRLLRIPKKNFTNRRNGEDLQELYGLSFHDPNWVCPKEIVDKEESGESLGLDRYQNFYKSSSSIPTRKHRIPLIDGACGISSVQRIMKAIGLELRKTASTLNNDFWEVKDKRAK